MTPIPTRDQADARAVKGISDALSHADRRRSNWSARAGVTLGHVAMLHRGEEHTIEEFRTMAHEEGLPEPPDARAWGGVTLSAIRRSIIIPTGTFRRANSSNGSPKPLYRSGI